MKRGALKNAGKYSTFRSNLIRDNTKILTSSDLFLFAPDFSLSDIEATLKGTNVTKIDLSYFKRSQITLQGAENILKCARDLNVTEIFLNGNQLDDAQATTLTRALSGSNVTYINFCNNKIGSKDAGNIANALRSMPITHISLALNPLSPEGAKNFLQKLRGTDLVSISLSNTNIGTEGIKHLAAVLPTMQNLNELILNYNNLGDTEAQIIAKVLPVTNLKKISFQGNHMSAKGVKDLVGNLDTSRALTHLDFCGNNIGKGASGVAKRLRGTSITDMNLSDNNIPAKEIINFIKIANDTNLVNLDINNHNTLSVEEAKDLANTFKKGISLEKLSFKKCQYDAQGRNALAWGLALSSKNSTPKEIGMESSLQLAHEINKHMKSTRMS